MLLFRQKSIKIEWVSYKLQNYAFFEYIEDKEGLI